MSYRIQPRANSTGINSQIPVVIHGQYRTFFVPPEVSILSHERVVRLVRGWPDQIPFGMNQIDLSKINPILVPWPFVHPSYVNPKSKHFLFFSSIFFWFDFLSEIVSFRVEMWDSPLPQSAYFFFNSLYFFVAYILNFSLMIVSLIILFSLNWSCLVKNGEFDFGESRIKSERKC